jgi:hypothetical protein
MATRLATLAAAAILGAGAALVATHAGAPELPQGTESVQRWEDGSWRMEGCLPGFPCALPLK